MSDTPRTDAWAYIVQYNNGTWAGGSRHVVEAAQCRELERELAAMTKRADAAEAAIHKGDLLCTAALTSFQEAMAERDEARAELARLTTLRPASEWDKCSRVLWFTWNEYVSRWIPTTMEGWPSDCWFPIPTPTPLPDVKEKE